MTINYKISKAKICKGRVYFSTTFILAKRISQQVILDGITTYCVRPQIFRN
ncbi:hypothetical protein AHAS_Ahas19G0103000 [Arachis hypogaea]